MELCVDNICMYVTKLCWGYVDVGWVELLFCPSYIKWSWILCQTDLDAFMCRKWFDMKWLILNLYSNITFEVKKVHTIETYPEKWINCVGKKLQMVICRHQVHPTVGVKQSACWYQRTGEIFGCFECWNIRHHQTSLYQRNWQSRWWDENKTCWVRQFKLLKSHQCLLPERFLTVPAIS